MARPLRIVRIAPVTRRRRRSARCCSGGDVPERREREDVVIRGDVGDRGGAHGGADVVGGAGGADVGVYYDVVLGIENKTRQTRFRQREAYAFSDTDWQLMHTGYRFKRPAIGRNDIKRMVVDRELIMR